MSVVTVENKAFVLGQSHLAPSIQPHLYLLDYERAGSVLLLLSL